MDDLVKRLRYDCELALQLGDEARVVLPATDVRAIADTIEAQAAEIKRLREAFMPGLNDDGICDDHGQFGCRVCMSPRQARALGEPTGE